MHVESVSWSSDDAEGNRNAPSDQPQQGICMRSFPFHPTNMTKALIVLAVFLLVASVHALKYPVEHFPRGNTTVRSVVAGNSIPFVLTSPLFVDVQVFAMDTLAYGGLFITGLGVDGQLWYIYQENNENLTWSQWYVSLLVSIALIPFIQVSIFSRSPGLT